MRIYFDENFSPSLVAGMQKIQDGRKSEEFSVHSVKDEFGKGASDEEWIPKIASEHGCVITQDLNIDTSPAIAPRGSDDPKSFGKKRLSRFGYGRKSPPLH